MNIEIEAAKLGRETTVTVDGQQLQGVRRVELVIDANDVTTLIVERYARNENGKVQVVRPERGPITVVTEHGTLELENPEESGIIMLNQTYNVSGSITLEGTLRAQEARVM